MGTMLRFWLMAALCVAAVQARTGSRRSSGGRRCTLEPETAVPKSPGDNFYRLMLNGNVEHYKPEGRYIVSLVGSRNHEVVQKFTWFKIMVQQLDPNALRLYEKQGQFQLFPDMIAAFDEECSSAVMEFNDLPKTEVQIIWVAPYAGSGCVLLKAMVYENESSWFAEDGQLTKRICEDTSLSIPDCCACDDAKYKMVFEGLWSPQTHPKDFPTQAMWLTHFSDIIGATHPRNFSFWGEGVTATDGFRSLAEWGSVGLMERELRQQGNLLRSIVKAQGLWYPKVNSNTSTTFTVDRKRHLLSLASMFGPSPDWVVGVSGLELCRKDCTWKESKVIDLFPYDAGTDNGISYMSPNAETNPREKMYRITPMYPEDPRAPFYNPPKREVPPMARLYLTRESLISRSCAEEVLMLQVTDEHEDTQTVDKPECGVTEWSAFSECSVSCGKGLRMRTREYRMPEKAQQAACERQLVSKEMCVAALPDCDGDADVEVVAEVSAPTTGVCAVSQWGAWSDCSATCGRGLATRRRHFHHPMGAKKCPLVDTEESRKCMEPPCREEEADTEVGDPSCPTTEWTAWSPCSASCGRGVRFRTRLLLVPAERQQECYAKSELMQQRPCSERQDCKLDMLTAKRICMEGAEQGPCRGLYQRWTFVPEKGMCVPFNYGGCRGTRNNFLTQKDCMDTCSIILGAQAQGAVSSDQPGLNNGAGAGSSADCQYSAWTEWGECSVSCGVGHEPRTRTILVKAPNGAPCDGRLSRSRRCYKRC